MEYQIREQAHQSSKFRACLGIGIGTEATLGVFDLAPPEVVQALGIHSSDNRIYRSKTIGNYAGGTLLKCGSHKRK